MQLTTRNQPIKSYAGEKIIETECQQKKAERSKLQELGASNGQFYKNIRYM